MLSFILGHHMLYLLVSQKSTCNEHHAVNDKFTKQPGLDITRIGATACSRHRAFLPDGVVNFQMGERSVSKPSLLNYSIHSNPYLSQKNMDYSFCHGIACSNLGDIPRIRAYYDVQCQSSLKFKKYVLVNPKYLSFPFEKNTIFGIGEFHINGHIPKCFTQYSPQFIIGAAITEGEILESLWSEINDISPSCASSSLPNCTETLDNHFHASNFRKCTGISPWLSYVLIDYITD